MYTRRYLLYAGTAAATLIIARLTRPHAATAESRTYEVTHSDEEWRKLLTPEQYHVLRHEGTERPFTSALNNEDRTFGMLRTAVSCHRCGSHLGHVFTDGPKPTGLRYCMNGVALKFTAAPAGSS